MRTHRVLSDLQTRATVVIHDTFTCTYLEAGVTSRVNQPYLGAPVYRLAIQDLPFVKEIPSLSRYARRTLTIDDVRSWGRDQGIMHQLRLPFNRYYPPLDDWPSAKYTP